MEVRMTAIRRLVALTALAGLPDLAAGQTARVIGREPVMPAVAATTAVTQTASLTAGWIEGHVTDDRSRPIVGAAVTAQGRDLLLVETDRTGRFTFHSVVPGTYLVRVQTRGFAASRREFLHVMPARGTRHVVQLRRLTGTDTEPARVIAAGASLAQGAPEAVGGPVAPTGAATDPARVEEPPVERPDDHDHSTTAWRLRHLKRPVLRDTTTHLFDDPEALDGDLWRDRRRFDLSEWTSGIAQRTASFLSGTALSGRVQLLPASAFDRPFEALDSTEMPAGIAYFTLGAPVSTRSTWAVEAAVTQGDVSSWFVAGSYATILAERHAIDVTSSYTRQRYHGANPAALAVFRDDSSRNAGGVEVYDRWTLTPRVLLTYGGRYDHYDYLDAPGLFSPSITLSISPAERTWVRASLAQQMRAPGAEEFVPEPVGSLALPPQRTFAALVTDSPLGRERVRHVGIALEREFATLLLSARHFRQDVDDQLVTVFGPESADGSPRTLGHYGVARAGSFHADGWGFGMSRMVASHLRGSIEYRTARANWISVGELETLQVWAPSAVRAASERVHDVTASAECEIRPSATRVLAAYRIDTAYARADVENPDPGASVRFDVQVHQGLPFMEFTRARWELLVAVRNLFHQIDDPTASLYDELLVVRPPKRVIGGVTVQF
jgi:TonB dependent receptor-like, beta-barrel/Carboxypeptidase regulatory-like domain